MSRASVDSTRSARLPSSHAVRNGVVHRNPRRIMKSASGSEARLSLTPARARAGRSRGMVTSIGSQGEKSRPSSQAAVLPENAARSGNRLPTAWSVNSTSWCRPVQVYWPRLIRRHGLVWRLSQLSQESRDSATVDGWGLRSFGRSEEHTSELQSPYDLVCRLLLEKKKN